MCQLFETLCVEMGRVLNIEYHQQRISGNISLQISDYIDTITLPTDDYTYKLRISYDMCGFISHTLNRYEPLIITSL